MLRSSAYLGTRCIGKMMTSSKVCFKFYAMQKGSLQPSRFSSLRFSTSVTDRSTENEQSNITDGSSPLVREDLTINEVYSRDAARIDPDQKLNIVDHISPYDGSHYVGETNKAGKRHGRGVLISAKGARYEGEFRSGKRHGWGEFTTVDGEVYVGEFVNGIMWGKCTITRPTGYLYEGYYENGAPHGFGVLTYPKGDAYSGTFVRGKRHGQGKHLYNSTGNLYEGNFRDDEQYGEGRMTYSNGDVYMGQWVANRRHGYGVYTLADGGEDAGNWEMDEFVGPAPAPASFRRKAENSAQRGDPVLGGEKAMHASSGGDDAAAPEVHSDNTGGSAGRDEIFHDRAYATATAPSNTSDNGVASDDTSNDTSNVTSNYTRGLQLPPLTIPTTEECRAARAVSYQGETIDGLYHGRGLAVYEDGSRYTGDFLRGLKHGRGKHTGTEGGEYIGFYKYNKHHGYGKQVFTGGGYYVGEWYNGRPHGPGKRVSADGTTYVGDWWYGKRNGLGKITYSDGRFVRGEFRNNKIYNGKGVLQQRNKAPLEGEWINGEHVPS